MESKEWLEYYKRKLQDSNTTYRPNGFDLIKQDLEVLEEIKKNHPDLYNLYKKMKEKESEWLGNGKD